MLFLRHDHPLIKAWLEARLRAELHRQHAPTPEDGPLQWLKVFRVVALGEGLQILASHRVDDVDVHDATLTRSSARRHSRAS